MPVLNELRTMRAELITLMKNNGNMGALFLTDLLSDLDRIAAAVIMRAA